LSIHSNSALKLKRRNQSIFLGSTHFFCIFCVDAFTSCTWVLLNYLVKLLYFLLLFSFWFVSFLIVAILHYIIDWQRAYFQKKKNSRDISYYFIISVYSFLTEGFLIFQYIFFNFIFVSWFWFYKNPKFTEYY